MRVLGLETSCDETAAAVVETGEGLRGRVLADVVHTQQEVHEKWGGVVPELASRDHLQRVLPVLDEALRKAGCGLRELDGISVTRGPGLVGALLVGVQVGKSLAAATGLPLVGVNHIEGHVVAVLLAEQAPVPPWLALVVSGGHTSLYDVRALGEYRALGHTLDDAAGAAGSAARPIAGAGDLRRRGGELPPAGAGPGAVRSGRRLPLPARAPPLHRQRRDDRDGGRAPAAPGRARGRGHVGGSGMAAVRPAELLRRHGLRPKKGWGQNFLGDEQLLSSLAALARLRPGDVAVELGAGLGHFTRALAATGAQVVAVERDRELAPILRIELPGVQVEEADAKSFDLRAVAARAGQRVVVCGNLPYHLSSPILFHLLDQRGDGTTGCSRC